jgi:acetylornithine/succinyldiaminopimelate/putrescine aminotransferase
MTLAKGLGGGLPIGALVIGERLNDVLAPGDHGSTFAGGPVVSIAAHAVLDTVDDEAFLARVRDAGELLLERIRELPRVVSARGRGLMIAAEIDADAPDVTKRALMEQHLIINATGATTLRFLPPLIVSGEEIDDAMTRLAPLLS